MWEHRSELLPQPKFTEEEIRKLPNIFEAIARIKKIEHDLILRDNGWIDYDMMKNVGKQGMPLHAFNSTLSSDRIYINNEDPDSFILNRLDSKRYCLKPNLRTHRFLFRGQKKHYPLIQSSFSRQDKERYILSNLKCEEFTMLLRTHPLFMLFERGIHLESMTKPLFLEMNYYGLSQHYNFNTGLIDFTSDIMASAFFAVTSNKGDDHYEPFGGADDNKVGVIYCHEINPYVSFTGYGFRTIGQQIYPRTGAQKGFCYQEGGTRTPVEKLVFPIFFRHDINCAKEIFRLNDSGKKLFPADDLSRLAQDIQHSNSVSGEVFAYNTYINQEDLDINRKKLLDMGIVIDWHRRKCFTPGLLKQYYENIRNGWWEQFCNNIVFIDKDDEKMKESLLLIPQNPHYKQYFDPRQLELLHYYMYNDMERANRNSLQNKV